MSGVAFDIKKSIVIKEDCPQSLPKNWREISENCMKPIGKFTKWDKNEIEIIKYMISKNAPTRAIARALRKFGYPHTPKTVAKKRRELSL